MAVRPLPQPPRARLTPRGRVALRVLAVLLLATAVVCLAAGVRDEDSAAAVARDERATDTALLSARRVPYVFTEAVAMQRLVTSITDFVGAADMCVAVDDASASNGPMVRVNGDRPLVPASTMKLLTGAGALSALGADHTFTTRVVAGGDGSLTLIGAGDPVLTTPGYEASLRASPATRTDAITPLALLADAIVASGVDTAPTLFVEDNRHDDVRFLPEWRATYVSNIGQLGALTVDDGTAAGARVEDPGLNAGEQLAALLRERGVEVDAVARGAAPTDGRDVGSVTSPPVAEIVAGMLTSSDNLSAELLVREIGIARGGDGSTRAGTTALTAALGELGVPMMGVELHDGSGLARANRVTCDALLAAVQLPHDPRFAALDRGLAVAGTSGTLVNRLLGDPLAGVLRGKTGNLDGVSGVTGIVDDGEHLRFAFLVNGSITQSQGQALQNDVARRVHAYPDAPSPAELVPPP